jgi:hypothetical protein
MRSAPDRGEADRNASTTLANSAVAGGLDDTAAMLGYERIGGGVHAAPTWSASISRR